MLIREQTWYSASACFFQRHFTVFAVHFPSADALTAIFSSILSAHFLQGGFSYGVSRSVGNLMQVQPQCSHWPSCLDVHVSFSCVFLHHCCCPGCHLPAPENQPELPPHRHPFSLHLQPARPLQHFPGDIVTTRLYLSRNWEIYIIKAKNKKKCTVLENQELYQPLATLPNS